MFRRSFLNWFVDKVSKHGRSVYIVIIYFCCGNIFAGLCYSTAAKLILSGIQKVSSKFKMAKSRGYAITSFVSICYCDKIDRNWEGNTLTFSGYESIELVSLDPHI